ncbi:MAG: beta-N-acetylhexosaminidase [Clostridia bacterium]|nr:beta-N-acetylhexosaminidase [Clostridia bacterium]
MRLIPQPKSIELYSETTKLREITDFEITSEIKNDESYELIITSDKITARASGEKGLHYARVSLKQILKLYDEIPCLKIKDEPRFPHRGFMIDCARHMFSLDELKKMISTAADFKFNKFHWHLSDDQGFRIELESLPELTEKGSVRHCDNFRNCKSEKEYHGFYTKDQIREIVEFCRYRFIDVIPEFDMPGHQSALLHVFPQYTCKGTAVEVKTKEGIFKDIICAGNLEAHACIEKILDELCELFPYDTVHIGGDEVPKNNWKSCGKCRKIMLDNGLKDENELQCWFINKMADYLKNKDKKCIVWNDCLKGKGLSQELTIQHWMGKPQKSAKTANNGQKIIMSPFMPFYVDYPYDMHPLRAVYSLEPENLRGLNKTGKRNIKGVESPIWTEFINNNSRLEYMCFPRWFAVAETGWTVKENKNYKEFLSVCRKLSDIYKKNGLNVAPEEDWNPRISERLYKTLSFFLPKRK